MGHYSWPVTAIPYIPKGDKNSRVQIILPYIESGLVWLPTESKNEDRFMPFADEFVESVSSFPNAESRDLVDTMTQALSYIRDHAHLRHPKDKYEDEIVQPRKKLYLSNFVAEAPKSKNKFLSRLYLAPNPKV